MTHTIELIETLFRHLTRCQDELADKISLLSVKHPSEAKVLAKAIRNHYELQKMNYDLLLSKLNKEVDTNLN